MCWLSLSVPATPRRSDQAGVLESADLLFAMMSCGKKEMSHLCPTHTGDVQPGWEVGTVAATAVMWLRQWQDQRQIPGQGRTGAFTAQCAVQRVLSVLVRVASVCRS